MNWQWQLYRDGEPVCDDGEMEVGVAIQFEEKPEGQPWADNFHIVSADGQVIFNSTIDYDSTFTAFGAPVAVALCLQNDDYEFIYNDGEGDGFALDENAFIEVIQDGEQIGRISGDFGPQAIVEISQVPGAPSLAPTTSTTPSPVPLPPSPVPPTRMPTPPRKPMSAKGKGYSPAKGKGGYYYHSHGHHGHHGQGHYHPAHGGIFQKPMMPPRYGYSMMKSGGHHQYYGHGRGMGSGGGRYYQQPRGHRYYGPRRAGWW
jgi:hypothetical protein